MPMSQRDLSEALREPADAALEIGELVPTTTPEMVYGDVAYCYTAKDPVSGMTADVTIVVHQPSV